MTTQGDLLNIYRDCFEKMKVNQRELAHFMNLGAPDTSARKSTISDKLKGTRGKGITKAEALAIQLLAVTAERLDDQGLSLKDLEFDPSGVLTAKAIKLLKMSYT